MSQHLLELKKKFATCPYASLLGIKLIELSQGYAKVEATLQPEHLNFLGMPHGGFIMSVADYAMSCASNTQPGTNVAVHFSTNFLAPLAGDHITAEAKTAHSGKTLSVCEVSVRDSQNKLIALGRGITISR